MLSRSERIPSFVAISRWLPAEIAKPV